MKTNANSKNIIKAVEAANAKYDNNLILSKKPKEVTKNVTRFVVKTKDRNKAGSFKMSNGVMVSKLNADAQIDIIDEIFKLENDPHIYVDTHAGRIWKDDRQKQQKVEKVIVGMQEVEEVKVKPTLMTVAKEVAPSENVQNDVKVTRKRRVSKRLENKPEQRLYSAEEVTKALNYILNHEEILQKA
jgi:hypothetical protein